MSPKHFCVPIPQRFAVLLGIALLAAGLLAGCSGNYNPQDVSSSAVAVKSTSLPDAEVGIAYNSGALTASGGNSGPYLWAATGLPSWATCNTATGAITGTPTQSGTSSVVVSASDSAGTGSQTFTLAIRSQVTVATASLPAGNTSNTYSSGALSATGGSGTYTWSATGLPSWAGISSSTGAITGTPSAQGTSTVVLKATDTLGGSSTKSLSLAIGTALSGNVSAPGGSMAFARPASPGYVLASMWENNLRYVRAYRRTRSTGRIVADLLASDARAIRSWWDTVSVPRMVGDLLVPKAYAGNPGVATVAAGVTVQLVQIDNSGNVVQILSSSVTDSSGNYTLSSPPNFTAGATYVVQAVGATTLQAFVTGTTVNVDPYTQVVTTLITGSVSSASASISGVSAADINAVLQTVLQTSGNVNTTSTSTSQLVTDLTKSINNNIESKNVVNSIASTGSITGTVMDGNNTALANIQILVRTFGDQTTTAMTRTDSSGNYTVHVPAGSYIVGAINDTTTSTAGSQWWKSGGAGTASQWAADKVTVGTTAVIANFALPAGGRLSGTIYGGSTSNPLAGINVTVSEFSSGNTLMWVKTLPDGNFTFNVPAGTYFVSARNQTIQPYATGLYSSASASSGGVANKGLADKVTVTAGSSLTGNMVLMTGYSLTGHVYTDASNTTPVSGLSVRIQDSTSTFAEGTPTGVDGSYRIWLRSGTYNILTRGQTVSGLSVTANTVQDFNANVSKVTGTIQDTGGNPLPQVGIYLYDCSSGFPCKNSASIKMIGYEYSNGDGTFTVYADPTANPNGAVLTATITDGRAYGSVVYPNTALATPTYNNNNYPSNGKLIALAAGGGSVSVGTLTLPAGKVLSGTVTLSGTPSGDQYVQVRYGGSPGAPGNRLLNVRTMSDGSFTVSLPAGSTVSCVIAYNYTSSNPSNCTGGQASVSMSTDQTLTLTSN